MGENVDPIVGVSRAGKHVPYNPGATVEMRVISFEVGQVRTLMLSWAADFVG